MSWRQEYLVVHEVPSPGADPLSLKTTHMQGPSSASPIFHHPLKSCEETRFATHLVLMTKRDPTALLKKDK